MRRSAPETEAGSDQQVARLSARLESEGTLYAGKPAEVLIRLTETVDILVIGSRGYGPLKAVLLGGVSGRVIRLGRLPGGCGPTPGPRRPSARCSRPRPDRDVVTAPVTSSDSPTARGRPSISQVVTATADFGSAAGHALAFPRVIGIASRPRLGGAIRACRAPGNARIVPHLRANRSSPRPRCGDRTLPSARAQPRPPRPPRVGAVGGPRAGRLSGTGQGGRRLRRPHARSRSPRTRFRASPVKSSGISATAAGRFACLARCRSLRCASSGSTRSSSPRRVRRRRRRRSLNWRASRSRMFLRRVRRTARSTPTRWISLGRRARATRVVPCSTRSATGTSRSAAPSTGSCSGRCSRPSRSVSG